MDGVRGLQGHGGREGGGVREGVEQACHVGAVRLASGGMLHVQEVVVE